ncbi:MAG: demethylmenaquinone methyltransferase [Bacillota bacterium]|nr:demethylmenaquinone methyltransferase [Bacillota bacterium]
MSISKEEQIHEVFESISERYDMMNSVISFCQHKVWRRDVIRRMELRKGTKAIDLCCGTGQWTLSLAREISPGEVYGVDFSENMLEKAREKESKFNIKNVRFLYGNVKELPFEDNYFHYATICFGLRNVSNYMETLKESWRVLKPEGKLICLETSRPSLPVFKQFYYLYMRYIVPFLGGIFTGRSKEYLWLQESTWNFPDKKTLAEQFRESGFENIVIKQYLGGVVAMHMGIKQKES